MPVRNKAAMATASATAVLVLLVPLLTGGGAGSDSPCDGAGKRKPRSGRRRDSATGKFRSTDISD